MKVTYLVDFFRTIQAGTETQLAHVIRALSGPENHLELIAIQSSPFLRADAPKAFPGVRILILDGSSDLSRSLPAFWRLYRHLRLSRPDLVHTFFPGSNSLGVIVARLAGVRRIISSRRDMGYGLTSKDVALLRVANRFVSAVAVNAHAIRVRTIKGEGIDPEKIRVIYNGIQTEREGVISAESANSRVVGIVANLNRPVKRVDVFIGAAARIHSHLPDVQFQIIGEGKLRSELESLAENLGVRAHIHFLGRRSDVQNLLKAMSIGVVSSDSEGLSNSLIEYMAAGLPAVATDVGGNSEVVENGKTGFLAPAGDAQAMAQSVLLLLEHPELARAMGVAGRKRAQDLFSMEGMVCSTRSLYEEICNRGECN